MTNDTEPEERLRASNSVLEDKQEKYHNADAPFSQCVNRVIWLPYAPTQYLTDVCEDKIVKRGDRLTVPILRKNLAVEVPAFKPDVKSVQIRKWTGFKILK
jgi:hypothetical protein